MSPQSEPVASPRRELRIKVWEDVESTGNTEPDEPKNGYEEKAKPQFAHIAPEGDGQRDHEIEDLPTTPLLTAIFPVQDEKAFSPVAQQDQRLVAQNHAFVENRDDADLPTGPLAISLPVQNQARVNGSTNRPFPAQSYLMAVPSQSPSDLLIDQSRQTLPAQANSLQQSIIQRPVTPALPVSYAGFQQPATAGATPAPFQAQPARRKSKSRLLIVLVLLVLLVVGGLASWIIAFHPFSVPAITQTTRSFQNTDLGIVLQYPQGWTAQLAQNNQAVSFFDANHTDQANVVVAATNGQSIEQYIKKEVSQLGLTAQKSLPSITFAAASWQQVQGTVLVSGATYTETLLVTTRGGRFYSIVQMAPAVTYASADHLFFSIMRASFQIL